MNKEAHYIYNVITHEGKGDVWKRIGAGWSHQNGGGMNLKFDFYPLDGKVVILKNKKLEDSPTSPPKISQGTPVAEVKRP